MRLSKNLNLHKNQILNIFQSGKVLKGKCLLIRFLSGHSGGAVLVQKKYGNAVRRNHFKRVVRVAVAKHKSSIPENIQFILQPMSQTKIISYQKYSTDILGFFNA